MESAESSMIWFEQICAIISTDPAKATTEIEIFRERENAYLVAIKFLGTLYIYWSNITLSNYCLDTCTRFLRMLLAIHSTISSASCFAIFLHKEMGIHFQGKYTLSTFLTQLN